MGKGAEALIITMAQADIPGAGRLNPRNRNKDGVGNTAGALGFAFWDFDEVDISCRGKIAVRHLCELRHEIIEEKNLVIRDDQQELQGCKEVLEGYLTEIANILERFQRVDADIAVSNHDGWAIINEIVELNSDIRGFLNYCKIKIAN